MIFKSEAQLKSFLLAKCQSAVKMAQDQVYQIVDDYVKMFYEDYSPEMYERTYQLYRSLVKTDVMSTANGYTAFVYFDLSSLQYVTGAQPTGEQVMDAAAHGGHGARGLKVVQRDIGVWDDPRAVLSTEAIDILKRMLIAQGVPIV